MNLSVIYEENESAEKIYHRILEVFNDVNYETLDIKGIKHLHVEIVNKNSENRRILNSPHAIKNSLEIETFSELMKLNRIPLGNVDDEKKRIRGYNILVCDLKVLSIQSRTPGREKERVKYIKEIENKKLAEWARRVMHTLGLDFGRVRINLNAQRKLKVMWVDPSPQLREKELEAVFNRIKKLYHLEEHLLRTEVKLGADPEFMLLNSKNGKMISASQFFPREGIVGCDNIRIPNRQQRPIAELRPKPEYSPLDLTENIKQALNTASRLAPYRNVKWLAGSQPVGGYSIGGHIHFSNIKINAALLRALDNYLGLLVFLIEDPSQAKKRRRKYGHLGDYRLKDYGGFEYRTPASWLVSREITTAVLCLAKIVSSRYHQLNRNILGTPEAQAAFYEGDQSFFRRRILETWNDLKRLDLYPDYAEELAALHDLIENETQWNEKADFRKAWRLYAGGKANAPDKKAGRLTRENAMTNDDLVNVGGGRRYQGQYTGTAVTRSDQATAVRERRSSRTGSNQGRGRIVSPQQVRRAQTIRIR